MKLLRILLIVPFLLFARGISAQTIGGGSIKVFSGTPSGGCLAPQQAVDSSTGNTYSCGPGGAWQIIGIASTGTTVSATDIQFGAKNDMRTCADMQMTSGSATLTSPAQCVFTSGDVGKWVQVPLAGDANGTGLSAQISGFTDSHHVTLSATAGATISSGPKVSYSDLVIGATSTQIYSVAHNFTPDQVGFSLTLSSSPGFSPGTYTISSVAYTGVATLNTGAGTPTSTAGSGTLALPGTIGSANYAAIAAVATYACAHTGTTVIFPVGAYYIEKYKIQGGGSANSVTDISWNGCKNTTVLGYGASLNSNGSYRQLNDNTARSFEQTVSPLSLLNTKDFTIKGLEINGNVENTSMAAVTEGESYGVVSAGSNSLSLVDLNIHGWPADGVLLGLNVLDTNDKMTNVFSHDNGRQGLTVANVNGLVATDYKCSHIGVGYTGSYAGHPPEFCTDIEPAFDPKASNISFIGGYQANAHGALFGTTPENAIDVTIENVTFDCSMTGKTSEVTCTNGGMGPGAAQRTVVKNNNYYGSQSAAFSCGTNAHDANWVSTVIENNNIVLTGESQLFCEDIGDTLGIPVHFRNNTVTVTGTTTAENGTLQFQYAAEVTGNTFSFSKDAKFFHIPFVIDYTGVALVANNVYSTDWIDASFPYAINYTNAPSWSNERSLNPTFFRAGSVTVANLPAAAAGNLGQTRTVYDSTAVSAEGQTCVGGSSNTALAFSNGTVWKCF